MSAPHNPPRRLRASVREAFFSFNAPKEGVCDFMYPDKDNRITTAVGYLIDSVADAQRLPWRTLLGAPASAEQVAQEWRGLKEKDLRAMFAPRVRPLTTLRLDSETIQRITMERLDGMAAAAMRKMPELADAPADAQLAFMSMCWALGVGDEKTDDGLFGQFPRFLGHFRAGDYAAAAGECKLREDNNAGVIQRNIENARLLFAAAKVRASDGDPEVLSPQRPRRPTINTIAGQQAALNLLGYNAGAEDGIMGNRTVAAVKAFQRAMKLEPDGIVGAKTMRALGAALTKIAGDA